MGAKNINYLISSGFFTMKITRGFLRATVCGAALFSAGILTTLSNEAMAACGTGGQCAVTRGDPPAQLSGGTYWATDWWLDGYRVVIRGNPALRASGLGATIDASNITVQPRGPWFGGWRQGWNGLKAQAEDGGQITLTDSNLSGGLNGISATGNGSQIIVTGGTINVINNAAIVRDTSRLIFNGGVAIAVTGDSSVGVDATDDAFVRFDNASVSATGNLAIGVRANLTSVVSINQTNIANSGNDSRAVAAAGDARVVINGGTINSDGARAEAISVRDRAVVDVDSTNIVNRGNSGKGIWATDNAEVNVKNANVNAAGTNGFAIIAQSDRVLSVENTNVTASGSGSKGLYAEGNAEIDFKNGTIESSGSSSYAGEVRNNSVISLADSTVKVSGWLSDGFRLYNDAKLAVERSTIEATGYFNWAVLASDNTELTFDETRIAVSNSYSQGLRLFRNAKTTFKGGTIEASGADSDAVYAQGDTQSVFEDSAIVASGRDSNGLNIGGAARVSFERGTVEATGVNANALLFDSSASGTVVDVVDSSIIASSQATALKAQGVLSNNHQLNVQNVVIEGGRLVDAQGSANLNIAAENSVLTGFATVANNANLAIDLQGSLWNIRPDTVVAAGSGASSISSLDFANSTLRFEAPAVGGIYQSLRVGAGNPTNLDTYNAGANSWLEINTFVNAGGAPTNQFTDRLLVEGNVSGQTVMTIREVLGSTGAISSASGTNAAHEGISLVQVSGTSRPDSFVIDGGYLTLKGKPYVHKLYAFGDGSAHGAADAGQRMVGGLNHWDYRLQNEFIRTSKGWAPQVAPQIASYLTAPTALFQANLMDVGNLQNRLGEMRHAQVSQASLNEEAGLEGENTAKMRGNFFLRGFGGDYNYHSNRNAIHYGYDADIRYAAVQAGGNLAGFDTSAGQMMFGLAGSYGDLSLSPDRFESRKTSMDVWTASAYASWLGNNGFYIDTILSYGGFSGDVSTRRYNHTARLKGNSLTASVEVGQNFALGTEGWAFEPQAQLTYQRLSFDNQTDPDDFAVTLGSPEQWVGRIGGKLSKDLAVESIERLQLYGKLNLIHGFGDGDKVFLGDDFRIGKFGTNIEAGLGLNLDMTKNASLYGDVSYQGRIGKGGTNGLSLNGGLRFQF